MLGSTSCVIAVLTGRDYGDIPQPQRCVEAEGLLKRPENYELSEDNSQRVARTGQIWRKLLALQGGCARVGPPCTVTEA